jgi:hypothetical protein
MYQRYEDFHNCRLTIRQALDITQSKLVEYRTHTIRWDPPAAVTNHDGSPEYQGEGIRFSPRTI